MKIQLLAPVERALRSVRDRFIFRPLAATRHVQRYIHADFELVVKAFQDHRIAYDPQDKVIGHHVGEFGDWFRAEFHSVVTQLDRSGRSPRGKLFIDVGANIGTQTVYALVSNDFARAVCFEPAPKNLLALKTNISINDLEHRAAVIPKAVGEASGCKDLMLNTENSGGHSLRWAPDNGVQSNVPVDMTTLDAALAELAIAPAEIGLIWMDVEGYEPEALAGASDVLSARVPLFIEINSHAYGTAGTAALLDRLASAGYRTATHIGSDAQRSFALPDIDRRYLPGDFLML